MGNRNKKKGLLKKLTYHYRILIINDDTYEEKLSLKLNRLNVFVYTTLFALILVSGTTLLIAFTPIRKYIPGYTDPQLRKNAQQLKFKADSLEKALTVNTYYLQELKKVLRNEITMEDFEKKYQKKAINPDTLNLSPSKEDSLLRKEVAEREKFKTNNQVKNTSYHFIAPLKGIISNHFDVNKKHYAIDVVANKGTAVRTIADGTVIYADWSANTGQNIIVKHENNVISIYKHNKKLLRKVGDHVKQGEVIATSGNSGKKTSGPHLHFELWIKGYPVNPTDFIDFKK
jgi:murein DD-endopeptidase MepM/ murein hydrolase activator NlpD